MEGYDVDLVYRATGRGNCYLCNRAIPLIIKLNFEEAGWQYVCLNCEQECIDFSIGSEYE